MTDNLKLDAPKITQITAESNPEIWAILQPPPLEDGTKGVNADDLRNPSADPNPTTQPES
jgi:hypothetical protein